jgi:hypothetical protein
LMSMTMTADERLISVTSEFEFEMTTERQNEVPQLSTSRYTVVVLLLYAVS